MFKMSIMCKIIIFVCISVVHCQFYKDEDPDTYTDWEYIEEPEFTCEENTCFTHMTLVNPIQEIYVETVVGQNEEKPYDCRTDICYSETTDDYRKGKALWPDTIMGQKVYVRCEFAYDELFHASRVCMYDEEGKTQWENLGEFYACPDPPLNVLLRVLKAEKEDMIRNSSIPGTPTEFINQIDFTMTKYKGTPIFTEDMEDIFDFIIYALDSYATGNFVFHIETLEKIANILDTFVSDDFRYNFDSAIKYNGVIFARIFDRLQILPSKLIIPRMDGGQYNYLLENIEIHIFDLPDFTEDETELKVTTGFSYRFDFNRSFVASPQMFLTVKRLGFPVRFGVVLFKHAYLYNYAASFYELRYQVMEICGYIQVNVPLPPVAPPQFHTLHEEFWLRTTAPSILDSDDDVNLITVGVKEEISSGTTDKMTTIVNEHTVQDSVTLNIIQNTTEMNKTENNNTFPDFPSFYMFENEEAYYYRPFPGVASNSNVSSEMYEESLESDYLNVNPAPTEASATSRPVVPEFEIHLLPQFCPKNIYEYTTNKAMVGSMSLVIANVTDIEGFVDKIEVRTVNVPCPRNESDDFDLTEKLFPICSSGDNICASANGLVATSEGERHPTHQFSEFYSNYYWEKRSDGCRTNFTDEHTVECTCYGFGMFTGFRHVAGESNKGPPIVPPTPVKPTKTDLAEFLGFAYKRELSLLGHVLGGVSLFCLLATVISYSFFKNTRRGKPSKILINLCISLIILYVVLYLSNVITISITGCMVANLLRYYLVFVSLFWNTVEAVNLYLMVVKVFRSNINRFVLKAGILAWGLPAVMVGVAMLADRKSFHGQYIILNYDTIPAQCSYKCQLRTTTLYYGYLIPVSVIFINNIVIFSLVMRSLLSVGQNQTQATDKRSKVVKVVGAVATLVLLGVPWIFSAFGVIDAASDSKLKTLEGIFQVVFIVLINLQGLFIFLFHCVRNTQVRKSWTSVFTDMSKNLTTVNSRSKTSSSVVNNNTSNHDSQRSIGDDIQMEKGKFVNGATNTTSNQDSQRNIGANVYVEKGKNENGSTNATSNNESQRNIGANVYLEKGKNENGSTNTTSNNESQRNTAANGHTEKRKNVNGDTIEQGFDNIMDSKKGDDA